jgi:hypothetical protein
MSNMESYQKLCKKQKLNVKQANQRIAEVALTVDETTALDQNDPRGPDSGITWSDRRFQPLNLYPHLKPNQKPSPADIETAQQLALKFIYYFDHGKVALLNKKNNLKVITLIEFTPLERLSEVERAELNTVARDGPGASGYPDAFWGKTGIRTRWRVSVGRSGYPRIPALERAGKGPAGRVPFQPARHRLDGWKGSLPAGEAQA